MCDSKVKTPFQLHLNILQYKNEMTVMQSAPALYFFSNIKKIKSTMLYLENPYIKLLITLQLILLCFDKLCQREYKKQSRNTITLLNRSSWTMIGEPENGGSGYYHKREKVDQSIWTNVERIRQISGQTNREC